MKKFLASLIVLVMLFGCINVYAEQTGSSELEYNTCISGDIALNFNDEWQPGFTLDVQHMHLPPDITYVQVYANIHIKGNTDADSLIIESALSSSINEKIEIDDNGNFDQEVRLILNNFTSTQADTINFGARVKAIKGDKTLIAKVGKGELKTNLLIDANNSLDQNDDGIVNALDIALITQRYHDSLMSEYNEMEEQESINTYIYNEWYMKDFVIENDEIAFTSQIHLKAKTDATEIILEMNNNGSVKKYEYLPKIGGVDEIKEVTGVMPVTQASDIAVYATIKAIKGNREIELKSNLKAREADKALVGDADGNGEVNSIDFMYLRKYIMGQIEKFPVESGFYCADVDDSRYINAIDFAYIRKYLLGMIKDFPKESNNVVSSTPTPTPPTTVTQTPTPGKGMVTYYYVNNIDVVKNPGAEIFVDKSPESKVWVSAKTVCRGPLYADGWDKTYFRLEGNAINGVDYEAIDFGYFWREIGYGFMETSDDNPKRGFYITPIDTGTNETKYVEIYFGGSTKPDAIIHFVKDLSEEPDDVDSNTPTPTLSTPTPTPTFVPYGAEVNKGFVKANTQFAANLFQKLSEEDAEKNIFFSPFSITMALSMPYQGAETTTKEAMAKALNYTGMSTEEINQSYVDHLAYYNNLYPQLTLDIANSIWIHKDFKVKESFLEKNKEVFNANSTFLDFGNSDACDQMNKWISDSTKGKINNLIVPPIDPSVRMYLMNAIYFNASWTDQFNEKETRQSAFKNIQGENKVVSMMNRTGGYNYAKTQEFQAIELPYCAENISMYCILPQNNNINDFIAEFDVDKWNEIKSNLSRKSNVRVSIPRFKTEYKPEDLRGKLIDLGMEEAFYEGADFSGIGENLFIEKVLHKAVIDMTESGTEAAASTVIVIPAPSIPEYFVADKPFMYVIADNETGTIVFMGKVVDF